MATTRYMPTPGQVITGVAVALATFAYPHIGEWLLERYGVRPVATGLLAIAALNAAVRVVLEHRILVLIGEFAAVFALLALAAVTGDRLYLQLFPALVNAYLAALFAATLFTEESMIERGARTLQPYLPEFTRGYCRVVTSLWVVFFAVFSVGILWVAVAAPESWRFVTTSLYGGSIMVLLVLEAATRKLWFRHYGDGPIDRLLATWFPADATERGRRSVAYIEKMHVLGYAPGGPRDGQRPPRDAD